MYNNKLKVVLPYVTLLEQIPALIMPYLWYHLEMQSLQFIYLLKAFANEKQYLIT